MMENEDLHYEEQVELKVTDKRKFNPDGSLREGVVFESEEPKTVETTRSEPSAGATEPPKSVDTATRDDKQLDEEDIPGSDDPASFVNFLSTLASQAIAALGSMPHPVTGQRTVDLDTGKYWIDVLLMLREKTAGNLHEREKRLFDGLLGDLQLQYVAMTRAAEEKLKQQAAKKFSAKDILGG